MTGNRPSYTRQGARSTVSTGYLVTFTWSIFGAYVYAMNGKASCPQDLFGYHMVTWIVSISAFGVSLTTFLLAQCAPAMEMALFLIDAAVGGGCFLFMCGWFVVGNVRLWSTRPCNDIYYVSFEGALEIVTRQPDPGPCCDNSLWWWTETYFILTYVLAAIGLCCICAMAGAVAGTAQGREAAERLYRGENIEDVYTDFQHRSAGGNYGGSGSAPGKGETFHPYGRRVPTESSPLNV